MPRQKRIDITGALHHIIVRGIERRKIFEDDQDRYNFIKNLGSILEQTQTPCYAWSLIPNHFHLLLRTGRTPLATVMRRLLTGHAVRYNRRHKRQGHLFQNRYKSILCQEDVYFLELVRYIHLNPLRAKLVKDLDQLERYPFSGHGNLMGVNEHPWQNSQEVLQFFDKRFSAARHEYRQFVAKGIDMGRRNDLTGSGSIRSAGAAVGEQVGNSPHMKNDERFLGDGAFVAEILSKSEAHPGRCHELNSRGVDINYIAQKVSLLLDISPEDIWRQGKFKHLVRARSLLCFWAVRELGINMTAMARRLNISTVAVSKSVARGEEIAKKEGFELI